jgi:hypothetical protein
LNAGGVKFGGVKGHLRGLRPRTDYGVEGFLFMRRIAFYGCHQVRDKVGTALIHIFNLRPRFHRFFIGPHQAIIQAYAPTYHYNHNGRYHKDSY